MIFDAILSLIGNVVSTLLLPLEVVNVAVDIVASIPVVQKFLMFVYYVLPWGNLLPIFVLVFSFLLFKIAISLIKTFWDLIPFV